MNNKYFKGIQNRILELLPKEKRKEKALLLEDCCSELSRLVASWISENDESSSQAILKGDNVRDTKKSHDILASIKNGRVYLIDPTIWQHFPNENSILVGEYSSIDKAISAAANKYGGTWKKSESLKKISSKEEYELMRTINNNIKESLNVSQGQEK